MFAVNVYRAATQAITHDEVLTFRAWVEQPLGKMFESYDPNNHVLNSLLMRLSVGVLGVSEFSLRLPSLLGGAVYLAASVIVCRRLMGRSLSALVGVAGLTLNPFVLDMLVAARGYGLGLGFMMLAVAAMASDLCDDRPNRWPAARRCWLVASVALGLALASMLAFLWALMALAGTFVAITLMRSGHGDESKNDGTHSDEMPLRTKLKRLAMWFALPGPLLALVILAAPLSVAQRDKFYIGADSLAVVLDSLIEASLRHHALPWPLEPYGTGMRLLMASIKVVVLPATAVAVGFCVASGWRRLWRDRRTKVIERAEQGMLLIGTALAAALVALIVAALGLGIRYPVDRTAVWIIPWVVLSIALLPSVFGRRANRCVASGRHTAWQMSSALALSFLTVVALNQLCQIQVWRFRTWPHDAEGRKTLTALETMAPDDRPNTSPPLRVGCHWIIQPTLEYYREQRGIESIAPIPRDIRMADLSRYDVLVLPAKSRGADPTPGRVLYTEPHTGVMIVRPEVVGVPLSFRPGVNEQALKLGELVP